MYEFDIEEIKDAIQTLSDKEKLEYLSDKETEILSIIEELQGYAHEITALKDEIEDAQTQTFRDEVQKALKASGYDIPWDNNGNLSMKLGEATVTIMVTTEDINVFFKSDSHQRTYCELIANLLPEFKQDGNFFSLKCSDEEVMGKVVTTVDAITNASIE